MKISKYKITKLDGYKESVLLTFYFNQENLTYECFLKFVEICKKYDCNFTKSSGQLSIKIDPDYDSKWDKIDINVDPDLLDEIARNDTKSFLYIDHKDKLLNIFSQLMVKCFELT